jgi:hypothetical protein
MLGGCSGENGLGTSYDTNEGDPPPDGSDDDVDGTDDVMRLDVGSGTSVGEGEDTVDTTVDTTDGTSTTGDEIDSFEDCLAFVDIALECTDPGDHAWVAYGESFGCVGSTGGAGVLARVLFRLDETVDGEPQLRGLRLGPDAPHPTDELVQWNAPALVPYAAWTTDVAWPLELKQMTFAGGLSFLVGRTDDAAITFTAIPPLETLMNGTDLQGELTWAGGDYDILQDDESIATLNDPTAQGAGCFHLPAELYPLELDG